MAKRNTYIGLASIAVIGICVIGMVGLKNWFKDRVVASGVTAQGHTFALVEGRTLFEGYAASFLFRPKDSSRWLRLYVAHQGDSWRNAILEVQEAQSIVLIKRDGAITHCFKWSPAMMWMQILRGRTNAVTEAEYGTDRIPPSLRRLDVGTK